MRKHHGPSSEVATRVLLPEFRDNRGMKMALAVDCHDLRPEEAETTESTANAVAGEQVNQVDENRQEKNRRSVPPLVGQ